MIEVLWHGRGGQGAFTAARLLGAAASLSSDTYALAFPSFGPERRGAPMRAFTKMDTKRIGDRSAIARADFVVYLDETLFVEGWQRELKDGGIVLVNSVRAFDDPRVVALDANGISLRLLGREIPNTTFLAALSVLADALTPDDAREAVRQYMAPKLHAGNLAVIDEVVAAMGARQSEGGVPGGCRKAEEPRDGSGAEGPDAGPRSSGAVPAFAPARPASVICTLRDDELDPFEFARTTTWEAGHLVSKNAGWRVYRPVLEAEKCTGCLQCYMQCPDGAIFKVRKDQALPERGASDDAQDATPSQEKRGHDKGRAKVSVAVDYDFCKGCGMCAKACSFGALTMANEEGAR